MTVYVAAFRSAAGRVPGVAEVPVDPVVSARPSSRAAASGLPRLCQLLVTRPMTPPMTNNPISTTQKAVPIQAML